MKNKNILIGLTILLLISVITGCTPNNGGGSNGTVPIVVTFNPQGGEVGSASKEVTVGSAYGKLPVPTRTGFAFIGWFTEKTGGDKVTSTTKVANPKNHTLYAGWLNNSFLGKQITVTFDTQGGTPYSAS